MPFGNLDVSGITPATVAASTPPQPVVSEPVVPNAGNTGQRQQLPPAETSAVADAAHQPTKADLEAAVSHLNTHAQLLQRDLQFSIDENSGQTVIKVIDPETKEVIRQIPAEETL